MAHIGFETHFIELPGHVGVDAQLLLRLKVRRGVGLAHQRGADAGRAQVVAQGQLLQRQRHAVPGHLVAAHIAPGVRRHARRPADGALGVGAAEAHPGGGQAVDVGRVQVRVAVARQIIATQLVAHDVQHVAHGGRLGHGAHRLKVWWVISPCTPRDHKRICRIPSMRPAQHLRWPGAPGCTGPGRPDRWRRSARSLPRPAATGAGAHG
ncbi:hypothetical protein D3C77_539840 [compost metagenome]